MDVQPRLQPGLKQLFKVNLSGSYGAKKNSIQDYSDTDYSAWISIRYTWIYASYL